MAGSHLLRWCAGMLSRPLRGLGPALAALRWSMWPALVAGPACTRASLRPTVSRAEGLFLRDQTQAATPLCSKMISQGHRVRLPRAQLCAAGSAGSALQRLQIGVVKDGTSKVGLTCSWGVQAQEQVPSDCYGSTPNVGIQWGTSGRTNRQSAKLNTLAGMSQVASCELRLISTITSTDTHSDVVPRRRVGGE